MRRGCRIVILTDKPLGAAVAEDLRNQIVGILPRLRRFALALTNSGDDADDLVQMACERAITRSAQWQPGTRLDSWMFRIIQNLRYDQARSRARQQAVLNESVWGDEGIRDGEREAHQRITLDAVRRAVAVLPEEQRAVILLVCVEGNSYRDAAEILGVPIGTVTSRLTRGRVSLARTLDAGEATDRKPETRFTVITGTER